MRVVQALWETVEKNALDINSWYEAKVETTIITPLLLLQLKLGFV